MNFDAKKMKAKYHVFRLKADLFQIFHTKASLYTYGVRSMNIVIVCNYVLQGSSYV